MPAQPGAPVQPGALAHSAVVQPDVAQPAVPTNPMAPESAIAQAGAQGVGGQPTAQPGQGQVAGQMGAAGGVATNSAITSQTSPMAATAIPEGADPEKRNDIAGLIKTIVIVILSLIAVTFVGLFIWMTTQYNEVSTDVNGQINAAVAAAVDENTMAMEMEFAEREKEPYRDFSGPEDYGGLSFKYPKTWSLYVAKDAANGGDYHAYFNPIEVDEVSNTTINALRLTIRDTAFDTVTAEYQRYVERPHSTFSVQSVTVAGVAANRYTGTILNTELEGIVVIFKIRDKTAILQTDSMLFEADYNRLLETIHFNA